MISYNISYVIDINSNERYYPLHRRGAGWVNNHASQFSKTLQAGQEQLSGLVQITVNRKY